MLTLLAQSTTTAPEPPPFDISLWTPTGNQILHAGIALAVTLLAAIPVFLLIRRIVRSQKLSAAYAVCILAVAFYIAAWFLKHDRMAIPSDPITFWITRAFAAAMTFVLLRLADRILIVPLLTRGGKLALPRFFHQIVNIVLASFAILIFGSFAFGWDIDKFLAGSAVVSIVLGLALQESLGNFFSGLVMQASPPFSLGDWIICGPHEGRVVDMTWRAVTLHTNDDNFILIPNATIAKAEVINFHAPSVATARTINVGLESDVPPADAISILKAAALETPGVQATPEPFVYLEDFGDAVIYQVKFWIAQPRDHHKLEHAVRTHIWYRLREKGIILPNPVRTIEHISQTRKARNQQAAARSHRLAAIESVPLLGPLSADQKLQLADSASEIFLTTGQILFRQNDTGSSFYIIYKGSVEVLIDTPAPAAPTSAATSPAASQPASAPTPATTHRLVATLKPGDFFGEMSALTGQPRTATIRAAAPLACVEIEKRDLLAIFQRDPAIMESISQIVAKRNAEREAILQNAGTTPAPETVTKQQKNLLSRMISFFGLSKAA